MDAKSHRIFTGDKRLGDVEFMRKTRAAGHPDPFAVDPNNHLGFNALEAQTNLAPQSKPRLRTHEMPRIVTNRIFFRRKRRINGERKINIGIGGSTPTTVSPQHPMTGHVNSLCLRNKGLLEGHFGIDVGIWIAAVIVEKPRSIQTQLTRVIGKICTR